MNARLQEIAEKYLQKSVTYELNEQGMARLRELRGEEGGEMEEFVEDLIRAARFLK